MDIEVAPDTGKVTTFVLKDDSGDEWRFQFQPAAGADVAAEHLQQHIDEVWPVLVYFADGGEELIALRVDDG